MKNSFSSAFISALSLRPTFQFGILLYPGLTLLDIAEPEAVLSTRGQTHLLWKTLEPVPTDLGVSLLPTTTFADCPQELDLLFIPGGAGVGDAVQDGEIRSFVASSGGAARYITSVCSGSQVLRAAGLLDGGRAAAHLAFYDALEALGAEARHCRVVTPQSLS